MFLIFFYWRIVIFCLEYEYNVELLHIQEIRQKMHIQFIMYNIILALFIPITLYFQLEIMFLPKMICIMSGCQKICVMFVLCNECATLNTYFLFDKEICIPYRVIKSKKMSYHRVILVASWWSPPIRHEFMYARIRNDFTI